MIKSLLKYFWSVRREFGRYFLTGITGLFLDLGSLILFKEVFGWSAVISVIVNQAFLLVYIFCLNKYWTFRNKALPHWQVIKFLILAGFNYLFSVFTMYIFSQQMGFDYRLVRLLTIAVMTAWNFILYKYWVYKS